MNLKGHTKIELFNAETGELEQEIHEDNMITNAISRAFNPPIDFFVQNVPISKMLQSLMPIQSVGMGGIMLFKNNITEDENMISLPKGNDITGYAGSVYSGTNIYRGTYNENESKALTNGYRHVWDFGTDRACGDISCVCLTHREGGNTGNRYASEDSVWGSTDLGTVITGVYVGGYAIGMVDKGVYCYGSSPSNKQIKLTYYRGFNSDKITLSRNPNQSVGNVIDEVTISLSSATLNGSFNSNRYYVDKNGILTMCVLTSGNINYCRINILTKTLIDEGVIPLNLQSISENGFDTSQIAIHAYLGNYYILKSKISNTSPDYNSTYPYTYIAVDNNGNFVKKLTTTKWASLSIPELFYDARLDAIGLQSHNIWVDSSLNVFRNYNPYVSFENYIERIIYTYIDIYPYFLRQDISDNRHINLILDRSYLATINNLATTITKTKEQTMKITYDITEV